MISNFLIVAIRNAMRHKGYAAIGLGSLVIGLTCALLIMLSVRYEMSFDAFRPHADRVYRIMKKERDARGQIEWRGALPFAISGLGTLLATAPVVGYQCFKAARTNPAEVLRRE